MGIPQGPDTLAQRARFLRDSLQKSRMVTGEMVGKLGSFDHRLSALEAAMRPTQVRTHAIRVAHENIDKTLKSADAILSRFDLSRQCESTILKGPQEDLKSYLEAVNKLKRNVEFFKSNRSFKSSDAVVSHANNLMSKAIVKLEEEFRQILSTNSNPVEPEHLFDCLPNSLRPASGSLEDQADSNGLHSAAANHSGHGAKSPEASVYKHPTLIPPRIVPLLQNLARELAQAGRQPQCSKIYRESRASALELSLKKLGVEKLTKEDVQRMQWEALEAKIGNWIHFMRIAVKLLFAGEKKLCEEIFDGAGSLREQSFKEVTDNSVTILLSFGEAIVSCKKSPEKLFVLLDMYEIMRELQPEIETIFNAKVCMEMRESALNLTKGLATTAQETFSAFEDAVEKDATTTKVLDGTVHPLTSYVINYVKFLYDYQSTLTQLFKEFETGAEPTSQLASVTMRIMQALQTNLDAKSKQYKDPALAHIFLMNNIHYMVRSVRKSEAKDFLGDDWVQRHRRIVQQNAKQYQRSAWSKILQTLSAQGLTSSGGSSMAGGDGGNSSGVSRGAVKERFKSFNMQFDELHYKQSQWTVPDTELRESLRLQIAEVLLPAYRSFVKRFGPLIENPKGPQKYVKYTADDLELKLDEFFKGKPPPTR